TVSMRYRIFRGSQIFHDLPGFRSPCAPRHPCAPRRAPASPQGLDHQAGPGAERDTEATGAWSIFQTLSEVPTVRSSTTDSSTPASSCSVSGARAKIGSPGWGAGSGPEADGAAFGAGP